MQFKTWSALCLAAAISVCTAHPAFAAAQNLPWEGAGAIIQASLTGPVAIFISISAITMSGATLVFGGELSDFARRMMFIVLVVAVIAGAVSIFNTLFTTPGASIALAPPGVEAVIRG